MPTGPARTPFYAALVICLFSVWLGSLPPVAAETVNYTYDDLNRLIKVEHEDGTVVQYTYDAAGNRLSHQVVPPAGGALTVALGPATAVKAGARWRVDGGVWKTGGATVSGLTAGSRKVEFKAVTGWTAPAARTVQIRNGQTTKITGTYVQQKGSLKVSITPKAAVSAGARWKVDALAWKSSGQTVAGLAVGKHTVSFKKIKGWKTPRNLTVTIKKNVTAKVSGKYLSAAAASGAGVAAAESPGATD